MRRVGWGVKEGEWCWEFNSEQGMHSSSLNNLINPREVRFSIHEIKVPYDTGLSPAIMTHFIHCETLVVIYINIFCSFSYLNMDIPFKNAFTVNSSSQLLINSISSIRFGGIDTNNSTLTACTRCVKIVENPNCWFIAN